MSQNTERLNARLTAHIVEYAHGRPLSMRRHVRRLIPARFAASLWSSPAS